MAEHTPIIRRTPDEVAEYLAAHRHSRLDVGAEVIPANSVRARLTADQQNQIDRLIHTSAGVYELEQIRQLGSVPGD